MPALDCISILEPGSITTDSGNVIIPGGAQFPTIAYAAFAFAGTTTVTFSTGPAGRFAAVGTSSVSFLSPPGPTAFAMSGDSTVAFIGEAASADVEFVASASRAGIKSAVVSGLGGKTTIIPGIGAVS